MIPAAARHAVNVAHNHPLTPAELTDGKILLVALIAVALAVVVTVWKMIPNGWPGGKRLKQTRNSATRQVHGWREPDWTESNPRRRWSR